MTGEQSDQRSFCFPYVSKRVELIDQNELSLKEIADAVGMRNVTHLYAFVRERCQVTPGELQKQRGGRPPVSVRRAATSSPTSGTAG